MRTLNDEQRALIRFDAISYQGAVRMNETKLISKQDPYFLFNFRGSVFAGYYFNENGSNPDPLFEFIPEIELAIVENHRKTIIAKLQPLP